MAFKELIIVGLGGFIGSSLRFAVGGWSQRLSGVAAFPVGTLVVNVAGCLCIGFLGGLMATRSSADTSLRLFLMTGVLGGFTTFSAFALDTLTLAEYGWPVRAVLNIFLQVILGLAAAAAGFAGARYLVT